MGRRPSHGEGVDIAVRLGGMYSQNPATSEEAARMIRVMVIFEGEPEQDRYEHHAALCRQVPGAVFRHGKVVRTLFGDELRYYGEFEFQDMESFKSASGTDEFRATGKDAADMGVPHSVYVVEVD